MSNKKLPFHYVLFSIGNGLCSRNTQKSGSDRATASLDGKPLLFLQFQNQGIVIILQFLNYNMEEIMDILRMPRAYFPKQAPRIIRTHISSQASVFWEAKKEIHSNQGHAE